MASVMLDWKGPYTFKEFICDHEEYRGKPGVYVQVGKNGGIRNIGKAQGTSSSVWHRQFNHYLNLIGGQYDMPAGVYGDSAWHCGYRTPEARPTLFDKAKYLELVSAAFDHAQETEIFVAEVDLQKLDGITLGDIESCLQVSNKYHVQKYPPADLELSYCGNVPPGLE